MRSYRAFVCALYIAVNRIAEFLSRARSVSMSFFYRSRADERNMYGRLIVDRVLVVSYPVMAYSVGHERPFRQVNGAQIAHGMYKSSSLRLPF